MLSKAPKPNASSPQESDLSAEEEKDSQIAASMLTQTFLSDQGADSLATALATPEPAKAVAIIVSQVIEMAQRESAKTEAPMSPRVWLAEGGAIDDAAEDVYKVAQANGIELPSGFFSQLKQEVAGLLQRRGKELAAQGEAPPGGAPEQQPAGGGAPVPVPQQGVM